MKNSEKKYKEQTLKGSVYLNCFDFKPGSSFSPYPETILSMKEKIIFISNKKTSNYDNTFLTEDKKTFSI